MSAEAPLVEHNELVYLQLEIARRAVELAGANLPNRPSDLALWLQAEDEIFTRHVAKHGRLASDFE